MADNLIYENTIDHGRFGIRVVGTAHGSYTGMLTVWIVDPYQTLLSMTVQLNYAPGADPDPNDIADRLRCERSTSGAETTTKRFESDFLQRN